jgi:large repetitive protein
MLMAFFVAALASTTLAAVDCSQVTVTVDVDPAPQITKNPVSTTVMAGSVVTLAVEASGNVQFFWYQGTTGDRTHFAGGGSSFTTPPIHAPVSYWVEAMSACGAAQSTTAYISVSGRRRPARN